MHTNVTAAKPARPDLLAKVSEVWTPLISGVSLQRPLDSYSSRSELLAAMYQNMMEGVADLVREWGLPGYKSELEQVAAAKPPTLYEHQRDLVKLAQEEITDLNRNRTPEPTSFDSWPVRMRAANSFNCVGGTLLGQHYLDQIGVEYFGANPFEHVMNAVRFGDGSWFLVDFTNGVFERFEGEEIRLSSGWRALRSFKRVMGFELFPLADPVFSVAWALGNLGEVESFANSPATEVSSEHQNSVAPAQKYLEQNREMLLHLKWGEFLCATFPEALELKNAPLILSEKRP